MAVPTNNQIYVQVFFISATDCLWHILWHRKKVIIDPPPGIDVFEIWGDFFLWSRLGPRGPSQPAVHSFKDETMQCRGKRWRRVCSRAFSLLPIYVVRWRVVYEKDPFSIKK